MGDFYAEINYNREGRLLLVSTCEECGAGLEERALMTMGGTQPSAQRPRATGGHDLSCFCLPLLDGGPSGLFPGPFRLSAIQVLFLSQILSGIQPDKSW